MSEHITNLKFVAAVEKHPCLYNTKLTEYGHKYGTEKAWEEVGEAFNLTAMQAKERWKNLRTVYVRNLKNIAVKKNQYYLADAMKFVTPYIRNLDNIINSNDNQICRENAEALGPVKVEECDIEEIGLEHEDAAPTSPSVSESSFMQNDSPSPLPEAETCYFMPVKHSGAGQKRKLNKEDERFNEYLKYKMSKTDGNSVSNANTMFLLSLLPDLNSMSPAQVRSFKRKVMDLMENVINETPQNR